MVYWFTAIIISVEKHSSANAFSSRCVATQQRTFLSPLVSCDTHYAVTSCQGRHSSQFIGQAGHGCHTLSSPPPPPGRPCASPHFAPSHCKHDVITCSYMLSHAFNGRVSHQRGWEHPVLHFHFQCVSGSQREREALCTVKPQGVDVALASG